jgi:integrase
VHNRRWEIGELFDTLRRLQLWDGPVLFGEPIAPKNGDAKRPLTDREIQRVRAQAYHWLVPCRRPLVVALAEAGGTAPEIAAVELEHLDLDNGVVHFTGKAARTNRIPPEAHAAFCHALDEGAAVGHRIAVTDALDANKAARSVTQELSEVIRDAGLARVPRVAGASIRLHHALRHFHDGGIGDAVRFLGALSVDTTMRSLGLTVDDL